MHLFLWVYCAVTRLYIKEVLKGDRGKNTRGEGGRGGGFKEVVGLPTSPQQGGGKSIDRWTYLEA